VNVQIRLRRTGYRVAYALLRVYWFIVRPRSAGVKCVLRHDGSVLLVRHTYGPHTWELPGGAVKRNEEPEAAARREIEEELGIRIERFTALGPVSGRMHRRRDTIHAFRAEIDTARLTLDPVEIAEAQWFGLDDLPANLGRYVRAILGRMKP
jgi:8-oxo-dGTP pyrophosphatase MutT (NUDIX family)